MEQGLDLAIVTGPHRSGTTFLGAILAAAERTVSLGVEPLNVTWGLRGVDEWYPEIVAGDRTDRMVRRLCHGERVRWRTPGDRPIDRLGAYRRGRARNRRLATARRKGDVVVLKDPFLSLSLEYAAGLTSRPVVAAVRHPAAWSLSLQRVAWHPGELLSSVPSKRTLRPVAERVGLPERDWHEAPLFEAAAWTWTLLVGAVLDQSDALGGAIEVLPLERFEEEPVEAAHSLIGDLGLEWGPTTQSAIEELTLGATTIPSDSTTHVLQRDTRASLGAWRSVIASGDRSMIWRIAAPVASRFYEP